MKTVKTAVTLLALVLLLTAGTVQSAKKPAEPEISNTRTASCLLKITTSEAVLPLNEFAVDYLLRSSGVAGKAAREVLEIPPDIASELITIEEIYSIDANPAGGSGMPSTTSSRASSYYRSKPTSSSSSIRRPTTRTPVPAQISKTPTSPSARPRTPSTTSSTSRYTRTTTPSSGYYSSPPHTARTTPTRTSTRRTPTKAAGPGATAGEQVLLFHLRVEFSGAINTIMSNMMDSGKFLPAPGKKISTDEYIKPAAEEFMKALLKNLQSALRTAFVEHNSKLDDQLNLADEEVKRGESELISMQKALREVSDSQDLYRHEINREVSSLRQKLQSAIMQRDSDKTLYEATAKRIAETQAKRKAQAQNDTITAELESLLAVHEARLKEIQALYNRGDASLAETQDAKEKIIRARIELAQRREQIINPGSVEISSLNDGLANLATNIAMAEQEMKSLAEQLEDAKDLLQIADQYELLSLKADIIKQNLKESFFSRERLRQNIRLIRPPDVTVIGAD